MNTSLETPLPLSNEWVLRYDSSAGSKQKGADEWKSNLKVIASITTVQDFWGVYSNIKTATALELGSNYHFFKKGIMPAWEDVQNKNGGKWSYIINNERSKLEEFDSSYLFTLLALIGEQFDDSEHISGVVAAIRKREFRLALWIKTTDQDICMSIGRRIKEILSIPEAKKINFESHEKGEKAYTL